MTATKKRAEPATERKNSVESCANCGQPATYRTAIPGAVERLFCDACGERAYPGLVELERL
jgi:hypothetical protein